MRIYTSRFRHSIRHLPHLSVCKATACQVTNARNWDMSRLSTDVMSLSFLKKKKKVLITDEILPGREEAGGGGVIGRSPVDQYLETCLNLGLLSRQSIFLFKGMNYYLHIISETELSDGAKETQTVREKDLKWRRQWREGGEVRGQQKRTEVGSPAASAGRVDAQCEWPLSSCHTLLGALPTATAHATLSAFTLVGRIAM